MATERFRQMLLANEQWYNPADMAKEKDRRFGKPNCPLFTVFESRKECAEKGVHARNFAGIAGSSKDGAFSICVSGGYQDDVDNGDYIIYTGTGGQEDTYGSGSDTQRCDQSFSHKDNAALKISADTGRPVRVVRGANASSVYAPEKGYRYDGMYVVKKAYLCKGISGYMICRFELERCPGQDPIPVRSIGLPRRKSSHT
ncbi:hypothetical protein D9613_009296 [Agrocybe pediades]|uniref:YDG domain-containing protein n=1 Tax=Agrocybe pediades TaxID=84607 RepID=A0A8H4R4U5_9AGAR|nr:hypothetical protein D9613_009296 [Agrocybe pediades]